MYTEKNFKTKKALKDDVKAGNTVYVYDTALISPKQQDDINGTVYLEGPHHPEPHKWYAQVECERGKVVKVIS